MDLPSWASAPGPGVDANDTSRRRSQFAACFRGGKLRTLIGGFAVLAIVTFTTGCFPKNAGPKLAHFAAQAPAEGERAPDFVLISLDGEEVRLSEFRGDRPVVLQFGSHSCPVYRYRRHSMRTLVEEYQDRVHFLMVYTVEAHPVGSKSPYSTKQWDPLINRAVRVRVEQPSTLSEREAVAQRSHEKLNLSRQMVVDTMNDSVWSAYGSAASPAFVLDAGGIVVLRQPWVSPKEIRASLDRLLLTSDDGAI